MQGGPACDELIDEHDELGETAVSYFSCPSDRVAVERLLYVHVLVPNASLTAQLAQVTSPDTLLLMSLREARAEALDANLGGC